MSRQSKAKRDARKKKQPKLAYTRRGPAAIQPHAELVEDGQVFGGAGRQGEEWVMLLGGRPVAGTESAAMMLAMLKHTAALREADGHTVQLNYSTALRDAATQEAQEEGHTLDEYLAVLEAERAERDAAEEP